MLRNEGDVKCQDCGHIASQHEDYSKVRPGLVTSSPQGIAFLLGYIFSSLAVADKYNRLDDDSRTGLLTGGAPGGSLDETFCPRTNTSELLLQMVIRSRVVYVRGTPACGKSTLAELLHRHTLETRGYLNVHSFTWEQTDDPWFAYLNRQSGLACLKAKDWASMKDTLIIIDEVQASFNDTGLWSDLIKPMSERPLKAGPMILIFGSYGSPLVGPRRDTTPMTFAPDQRVSLQPNFHLSFPSPLQQEGSISSPELGLFFNHTE